MIIVKPTLSAWLADYARIFVRWARKAWRELREIQNTEKGIWDYIFNRK